VTSDFVSGLFRQDCALSLFAVATGPQEQENRHENEQVEDYFDDYTSDYSPSTEGDSFELETPAYPPLNPFSIMNQGVRHETLQAAMAQAFSCSVRENHTKHIHIRFMGDTLLIGTRRAKSFTINTLEIPAALGFTWSKEDVLELFEAVEADAGFSTRMDDFLSTELGL
jgi:hypothetical protein